MNKKTSHKHLWLKKACCFILAFAMIFSSMSIAPKAAAATATTEAQDIADFAPPSSVVVAAGQFVTVLSNGQIAKPSSSVMNQRDKVTNSVVVLSRSEGVSMGQGSTDKSSKQNKQQESADDIPEVPDVPETPDVPDDTKPEETPKTGSVDVNVSFE